VGKRFNTPPGWPEPPPGWLPSSDFTPDPSWPPPPEGWELITDDGQGAMSQVRGAAGKVVGREEIEDPDVLWHGQSQTISSAATGGWAVKGRYRLTHEFLYFERGTLRTDAQQVPIVSVVDVDLKQSLTQKARGVGDVIVHIQRSNDIEIVRMESLPNPREAQVIINRTAREARYAQQQRANTMRYEQSTPPSLTATLPPVGSREGQHDPIDQLRKLGDLRDAGILTTEEFEAKKSDILGRL
jgi:hypothetical protein